MNKAPLYAAPQVFEYLPDRPPVEQFGLQSFWFELGERSYMKEPLALQVRSARVEDGFKGWKMEDARKARKGFPRDERCH